MTKKNILYVTFPVLLLTSFQPSNAQTLYNNGGLIYAAAGSIVQVNGGMENAQATGDIQNYGTITVATNTNPGNVTLSSSSVMRGDGTYRVEQDWINNATFTCNNSTVEMFGNTQQLITSTNGTVTTFHHLTLTGTGTNNNRKKTLRLVNAITDATGILTINNRELDTDTNTIFVMNTALTAVTNNTTYLAEGFVSSLGNGSIARQTANNAVYLFPTGSSLGTVRYRPVQLTPQTNAANMYRVRLVNNNATANGYNINLVDTGICRLDSFFYHKINRTTGTDPATIQVFYDQVNDGAWDKLAQWNTPTTNLWNNMGAVTASTNIPYNDVLKANWANIPANFTNDQFILGRVAPNAPLVACSDVCANSIGNIFTATGGSGNTYSWSVTGGTITSGQGSNQINVAWGTTTGTVTVTQTNSSGCTSAPASCVVNVFPSPTAGFDTTSLNQYNTAWSFVDQSSGSNQWYWDFGDGTTSTSQNPNHQYTSAGTYTVMQVVRNQFGCYDTLIYQITVREGIIIPNVFTPNGDGTNDQFYIPNSGVQEFYIEIFNRWGLKVFEANASEIRWDGRSTSGVLVSDGTYFYILKAILTSGKDFSTNGFVQVLGQNIK